VSEFAKNDAHSHFTGSNTVICSLCSQMPYSQRIFPHFAWKNPLHSVFAHVGIFDIRAYGGKSNAELFSVTQFGKKFCE